MHNELRDTFYWYFFINIANSDSMKKIWTCLDVDIKSNVYWVNDDDKKTFMKSMT